jgi:hypothetical protein
MVLRGLQQSPKAPDLIGQDLIDGGGEGGKLMCDTVQTGGARPPMLSSLSQLFTVIVRSVIEANDGAGNA